jgi:hypothetical protein
MHHEVLTKRQIGKFVAYDALGKADTVYIYTDNLCIGRNGLLNAQFVGRKDLHLANGWLVNRMHQGVYEIGVTGTILRSSDSKAP